jgi:hypothetical protein
MAREKERDESRPGGRLVTSEGDVQLGPGEEKVFPVLPLTNLVCFPYLLLPIGV